MENLNPKEQLARWVENWKETGAILEEIRREDIRNSSTAEAILALNDAFASAIINYPPPPTSGLVEQQKAFKNFKKK